MCEGKCNLCRYILRKNIANSYYDVFCSKTNRVLGNYIRIDENIRTPYWCPDIDSTKKTWKDLKPQVSWDKIKNGDVYHMPPFNGNKRYDIKVINVSEMWLSYKKENSDTQTIFYLYPSDKEFRFLVKKK